MRSEVDRTMNPLRETAGRGLLYEIGTPTFTAIGELESLPTVRYRCPKCNSQMILKNRKDSFTQFYACLTWPDCTGTRTEDGMVGKGNDFERWAESFTEGEFSIEEAI